MMEGESIPRELHALACSMFLTINSSQDGAPALIERFGHMRGFREGIRRLGWLELDLRLGEFLALMEPYTDDTDWWDRFSEMSDTDAFERFGGWLLEQDLELERRVVEFVRKNEGAIFVVS